MVLQATAAQRPGIAPDHGIDYQLLQAAREMSLPVQELAGGTPARTTLRSARWRDGAADATR